MNNKDLIKQYVNTGVRLPEYQLNKLSPNDLRSYLRLRLMYGNINGIEFDKLEDEEKDNYVKSIKSSNLVNTINTIGNNSPNDEFFYRLIKFKTPFIINELLNFILPNIKSKYQFVNTLVDEIGEVFSNNHDIHDLFYHLTDEQRLAVGTRIMGKRLGNIKGGFTSYNSPMIEIMDKLENQSSFIKYVIDTNVKINGGEKIELDEDTFLDIIMQVNEKHLGFITKYLEKYVNLTPKQEATITHIRKEHNL